MEKEEKNFREIWKEFWKNSSLMVAIVKSLMNLVIAIGRTIAWAWMKLIKSVEKRPMPYLLLALAISVIMNIYLFVSKEYISHNVEYRVGKAIKDSVAKESALQYHEGYKDGKLAAGIKPVSTDINYGAIKTPKKRKTVSDSIRRPRAIAPVITKKDTTKREGI